LIARQARTYKRDGGVGSERVDGGRHRHTASARFAPSPVEAPVTPAAAPTAAAVPAAAPAEAPTAPRPAAAATAVTAQPRTTG
jgi:hypothetical protein